MFVRLGVFDPGTDEKINGEITRFDAALFLERLLGASDESRAADYFRTVNVSGTVDFMTDPDGSAANAEDGLGAAQAYAVCLQALDYFTESRERFSDRDAFYALAKEAGFGNGSVLFEDERITVGQFALILRELLLCVPKGGTAPVYRILAYLDSGFKKLLTANGFYDDVPEELCPRFSFGRYVPGSFFSAVSDAKSEWSASYSITGDAGERYGLLLEKNGWILEGRYSSETEPGTEIWLYYKANESAPDGEMGLVLKLSADGILSWNLLA